MELEALKTIWSQTLERQSLTEKLSPEDIRIATEQKSNMVISKIKKRLTFKIWAQSTVGILGSILSIMLLQKGEMAFGVVYIIVFPLILGLGLHKYRQHRMIVAFEKSSFSLLKTLLQVIRIMKKVIQAQILTATVVGAMFVGLFTYIGLSIFDPMTEIQLLVSITAMLLSPIYTYRVARQGQQKMFGKYLQTLEEYTNELKANDQNYDYE